MKTATFLKGMLLGTSLAAAVWYWQKSTSDEEGALDVLDRLAASEARLRDLREKMMAEQRSEAAPDPPRTPAKTAAADEDTHDDLREIEGIGPTYARRLHEAGVTTFAALAALPAEQVVEITGLRSQETAVAWIIAAEALSAR